MRKQSKWNRVIAVVLTASLVIPEMAADVFAYSSANIVKEENEVQMDMDLESEEETETDVTEKLTVTSQPADVTAYSGTSFTFTISAEGTNLTYLWQSSCDNGATWTNTTCTSSSYTGTASDNMNGNQFRCIVTDGSGNTATSAAAMLTVNKKVAITSQLKDVTVYSGQTFTMSLTAEGTDLTYMWQLSLDGGTTWYDVNINESSISEVAFDAINGCMFRCVVTDGAGNKVTSRAAKLTVTNEAVITSQPSDVTVYSGNTFNFAITAEGADLTYLWQYSADGGSTWSSTTCTNNSYTGIAAANLNGHLFRCVVTDATGNKITSNTATLTVNKTAAITTQPSDVTVYSGKSFTFAITAEGTDLSCQWQRSTDNGSTWSNISCTSNSYSGTASDAMNGYEYRCVVMDGAGNKVTSAAATLTVNKTAVITSQPSDVTVYTGKSFTFAVTAEGTELSYQWQRSTDNGSTWSNISCTTTSYNGTASDAMNGYEFRCVITDGAGNKVISNAATLTVNKAAAITDQPSDVTVYSGNSFTFVVTATGTDLSYQWQSSTDNGATWSNISGTKSSYFETASSDMNGTMFRCVVTDGAGNTVTSSTATLTVKQKAAILVQPKDITASNGQIFTVSVTAVGTDLTYMWQLSLDGKTWYDVSVNEDSVSDIAFTFISGCEFRCIVTDGDGNTVVSDIATLTVR